MDLFYAYLFLLIRVYTIVPLTAARIRQHPAVMMITLPAAAEQSQSEKSEEKKNTQEDPKCISCFSSKAHSSNTCLIGVYIFLCHFSCFCHIPITINSWFTVRLCPVTVFAAVQVYVPPSELLMDGMMYTASSKMVGFPLKSQVNFADGTDIVEQ